MLRPVHIEMGGTARLKTQKNKLIQAYFGPRLISPSNDPAANSSPEPIQFVQELHKAMAGIETLQK